MIPVLIYWHPVSTPSYQDSLHSILSTRVHRSSVCLKKTAKSAFLFCDTTHWSVSRSSYSSRRDKMGYEWHSGILGMNRDWHYCQSGSTNADSYTEYLRGFVAFRRAAVSIRQKLICFLLSIRLCFHLTQLQNNFILRSYLFADHHFYFQVFRDHLGDFFFITILSGTDKLAATNGDLSSIW